MLIYLQAIQNESERNRVENIYRNYGTTMLYIARGILKEKYSAEDAVSQAFIKIINNLQKISFENCNKTKGLIVIIVRNICYDMLRSEKHEKILPLEEFEDVPEDAQDAPLNLAISEEGYDFVMACLSDLREQYKDILRLKLVYEYTDEEISKILDISQENVRVRFHRARKALIEVMKKRGDHNE
jgi:RNA polymerase sigma-70 factor (ECF subfamily)